MFCFCDTNDFVILKQMIGFEQCVFETNDYALKRMFLFLKRMICFPHGVFVFRAVRSHLSRMDVSDALATK